MRYPLSRQLTYDAYESHFIAHTVRSLLPLTNFTLALIYQKLFSTHMHNWLLLYICRKKTYKSAVIRSNSQCLAPKLIVSTVL